MSTESLNRPNPNFKPSDTWRRLNASLESQAEPATAPETPALPPGAAPAASLFATNQTEEPAVCEGCKRDFQSIIVWMDGKEIARGKYCQPCVAAETARVRAEETETKAQAKKRTWELICPEDYRDTDLARLRADLLRKKITLQGEKPKPVSLDEIWRWDHKQPKGLGLIGVTGQRKSRIIYELLRRYHFQHGIKCLAINAVHFADDLAACYENGPGFAERFMEKLEKVRVLLIDDLGKEQLTSRVESTYYRIVEYRKSHKLPLFFTANMGGDQLIQKWQANAKSQNFYSDRAEPIVRRLREMCDSITITNL